MVQIINQCFLSAAVMALVCFFSFTEHITTTHRLPFFVEAVATDTDVTTTTNYPGVKWRTITANHEEMTPIATRQEYPPTIDEDDTPIAATNSFWHALPMTESPVVEKEVKDIIWDIQMSTPNEETYIATSSFNWHEPSLLESPTELEEVKDEDVVNGAVEMEETEYLQRKDPCEEEPIRALRSGGRISKKSRVSQVFQVPCHIVIRLSFFHKIIYQLYSFLHTVSMYHSVHLSRITNQRKPARNQRQRGGLYQVKLADLGRVRRMPC